MSLTTTITPDTGATLDSLAAWSPAFPSADLVSAAAAMMPGYRVQDRRLGVTLNGLDVSTPSGRKGRELHPPKMVPHGSAGQSAWPQVLVQDPRARLERATVEGPRYHVLVSPGTVAVRSLDPVRRERAVERARLAQQGRDGRTVPAPRPEATGPAVITSWSSKSRARMVEVLGQLDWSPMFDSAAEGELPAMVTLTYPGDWLAVAPHAAAARRHFKMLRSRFERAWGRKIIGAWKREFQRRGAPHFHVLMIPPHGQVNGLDFRAWLSLTWANIVGAARCEQDAPCDASARCEYHAHRLAGTGVDYADGLRARDPQSVGVYFSKHGSFASKDYQNDAPEEWSAVGSVGRYWGVWGLSKAVAGVEVHPDDALTAARTLRRWSRAQGRVSRVSAWKYRTVVDPETGEVSAKWRKGTRLQRVYRLRYGAGFVTHKDAPALAAQLARVLTTEGPPPSKRWGSGPRGFLP